MPQDDIELEFSGDTKKATIDNFLNDNKVPVFGVILGLILLGVGVFLYRQGYFETSNKVEILNTEEKGNAEIKNLVVEISGAVEKPGVYKLSDDARVEDALIAAGGISANADREWVEKYINRAAKITDGQKIYIYKSGEVVNQSLDGSAKNSVGIKPDQWSIAGVGQGLVNINTASLSVLDSLPGIGQVYGQSIIDHRPYSSIEELVSKDAIKQNVFEKVKDKISVY